MSDPKPNAKSLETATLGPKTPETRTLEIDWQLYEEMLGESDLTPDQKRQFLEALWSIMVMFVDLGFGIRPTPDLAVPDPGDHPDQEPGRDAWGQPRLIPTPELAECFAEMVQSQQSIFEHESAERAPERSSQ